jgi:hypothetical protein
MEFGSAILDYVFILPDKSDGSVRRKAGKKAQGPAAEDEINLT